MKYNKKEQLFDKIRGLEFVSPDEYGAKYNKGVREAKAIVVSFFNKELVSEVPQYVIDWYEENKDNLDYNLWNYIMDWEDTEEDSFKRWVNNSKDAFQTIINMHQFGYKIKEEKKYKEMYYSSLNTFDLGGLLIFDKEVINTRNVTYTEIIKERVMNIDKHY